MPSSNIQIARRYYPKLSEIVTVDDLPESLSFIQEGLNAIFDKIHYKNLQYSKSYRGDSAFYSLDIVTKQDIGLNLLGNIRLILNPDATDSNISSFPVRVEYQWEILGYLRSFSLDDFAFSPEAFFNIGLQVFRIDDGQIVANTFNFFVNPTGSETKFENFASSIDEVYPNSSFTLPENPTIDTVTESINNDPELGSVAEVIFNIYILRDNSTEVADADTIKANLEKFFTVISPGGIQEYIKKIIVPRAKASFLLSAGLQFPREYLKPVYDEEGNSPLTTQTGEPLEVIPTIDGEGNPKVTLLFGEAEFFADTEKGLGYSLEFNITSNNYAQIGNTGLIVYLNNLKIDLSKDSNIPEADSDGRPPEFIGVYAEQLDIFLPKKWFKKDSGQTLKISGKTLLIGTGGISGTIGITPTYAVNNDGEIENYYQDYFDIDYPVTVISGQGTEVEINSYNALVTYMNTLTAQEQLKFKYPINLVDATTNNTVVIPNEKEYNSYINLLQISDNNALWFDLGGNGSKSWRLGFKSFDVTFKQNQVVDSHLHASVELPKFKNEGQENGVAVVDVYGEWKSWEDFELSASFLPDGLPLNLFGLLTITFQTAKIGSEEGDFFIEADTKISFPEGTLAYSLFNGQEIDLPAIRVYFDGRFEIVGGNAFIPVNFTLPIGPIEMSVTGIHFGSIQRERGGKMRKYNYIGFDGGISVDPFGIDVRGNGVKYYYTIDNDEHPDNYSDDYFHISTLEIDLIIPGTATPTEAIAIIKGSLTIPEPGVSTEYRGSISIQLPKPMIYGSAAMRLNPRYPAFLIDASVEFPVPIPLGPVGIFGFRGLLGYRYVAEKQAIGLTEDDTWYDYYMTPQRGINVDKFSGPEQTTEYNSAFSVGVGASIATMDGGGRTASLRAMLLLSLPSMFAIDAGLTILSERLGMAEEDPSSPPFYAFVIIGDDSLEFGAGANYQFNKSQGWLLDIKAEIQAGFFFKNQRPWYINFGTKQTPITSTLFKTVLNIKSLSFLMLSASGIEAGARVDFDFDLFIAKLYASLEVGGYISFERPQIGGYMRAEGSIKIDFWIFNLSAEVKTYFSIELPKPFLIIAQFSLRVCASISYGFGRITICRDLPFTIKWSKNNTLDAAPIPSLTYQAVNDPDYAKKIQTSNFVKGVHMMTFETFEVQYLGVNSGIPDHNNINNIIPLDTYIDIKVEKGLIPSAVSGIIGGHTGGSTKYVDLIPPKQQLPGGKTVRQVKHKYSIEEIEIKAWSGNLNEWVDYHPYKAIAPEENVGNLKVGYWQKNNGGNYYDTIRLLATTPFAFLDGAEPGWFIPEQYGITPSTLFCTATDVETFCFDVLNKNLNKTYYPPIHYNADFINGAYLNIKGYFSQEVSSEPLGEILAVNDTMVVSDIANPFGYEKSLTFDSYNTLVITLPEPTAKTELKLTTSGQGATIRYFRTIINDDSILQHFALIEEVYKTSTELQSPVVFDNTINYSNIRNVSKIEITPDSASGNEIYELETQLAELMNTAEEASEGISYTILQGEDLITFNNITAEIAYLKSLGCSQDVGSPCNKDENLCDLASKLSSLYMDGFIELSINNVYDYCMNKDYYTSIILELENFDSSNPEYGLIGNHLSTLYVDYKEKLDKLIDWCGTPEVSDSEVLDYYNAFMQTANSIISTVTGLGNCDCGESDEELCSLHSDLTDLFNSSFLPLDGKDVYTYCDYLQYYDNIITILVEFDANHPDYLLIGEYITTHFEEFKQQLIFLKSWCENTSGTVEEILDAYNMMQNSGSTIINIIGSMGNCNEEQYIMLNCKTSVQSLCWQTLENFEYMQTIPAQEDVEADIQAMIEGVEKTVQPVWRPNTTYYIKFKLKDEVDNGQRPEGTFDYYYGFKTVGPVGHFHKYPNAYTMPPNSSIEEFSVASLNKYIDYKRSYPNADGNILLAKPLFYGNEQCTINIYFSKDFAYHMLNTWKAYPNAQNVEALPEIKGAMHLAIKDPVSDVIIPYPLPQDWETHETVPETIPNGDGLTPWSVNSEPPLSLDIQIFNDFIENSGDITCQIDLGDLIKPASYYYTVQLSNLKPRKLYTALVYNAFDENMDGNIADQTSLDAEGNLKIDYEESQKVHEFVFQTSRYANFTEQVMSYVLKEKDENGNVINEKEAVFEINTTLTTQQAQTALTLVSGSTNTDTEALALQFYHPFDRVLEGIFGLTPPDPPTTTDFIKIKDVSSGNIVALLIRNPEPFNNPKIPIADILDTIQVVDQSTQMGDENYKTLFSKDYSQAIIMNQSASINTGTLPFQFKYKTYTALDLVEADTVTFNIIITE
ncbi:hypothetical protein DVK85_04515 [Flavobacterium arcticum]|uniref:Uncharacterized protein n=1 Tax=Flavobacterium arcticum TaxID=1784713 RepID=A0A345HAC3_9FLAO|nr:hypothetical protein [Flavobacterium arcticum]AXG73533.1 hypothetical protein DVK85_04515 [Flavobacterium arcticum]KAF2513323.1 hypothetical protein E0W72_02570 [Flavobacterium arcticum]